MICIKCHILLEVADSYTTNQQFKMNHEGMRSARYIIFKTEILQTHANSYIICQLMNYKTSIRLT